MTFHHILRYQMWLPTVREGLQPTSRGRSAFGSVPSSIFDTTGDILSPEPASGQVRTQNASKVESLLMSGQKNHLSLTVQLQNIISQRNAGRKNNGPGFTFHFTVLNQRLYRLSSSVWYPRNAVECMLIHYAVSV